MPKLGSRVGAGRKPVDPVVLALRGGVSRHRLPDFLPTVVASDILPPENLTPEEREAWDALAPHAITAGTLTPLSVFAFCHLCWLITEQALDVAQIEREGRTYMKIVIDGAGQEHQEAKKHPLTGVRDSRGKEIRACLKDFGLNPFGKPMATAAPVKVNPLDRFLKHA